MARIFRSVPALALCCSVAFAEAPAPPNEIEGLEAWYRVELSELELDRKNSVISWRDASGHGHELKREGEKRVALLRHEALNGLPALKIEAGSFKVAKPFALLDHTIFVVARSRYGDQALFRDPDSRSRGVVLYQDGRRHVIRVGGVGSSSPSYSELLQRTAEFSLTVLGRDAKVLHSWIDGADFSSWMRVEDPVRFGNLFHVEMSQFVERNGNGLELAELLVYTRYLGDDERQAVSDYLASKYGLQLRESIPLTLAERMQRLAEGKSAKLASLHPKDSGNLNDSVGHRIAWGGDSRKQAPFRHEEGEDASRIYCTADGTSFRLYLSLPLRAVGAGVRLRALVLRNGAEYLEDDAETPVLGAAEAQGRDVLELETELTLDDGDYIEIVTFQLGGQGTVKIGPEASGMLLEPN